MIHTNIIARVERYENGVADLEPLFLDDDGQPYSKIVNARALSQRFLMPKNIVLEGNKICIREMTPKEQEEEECTHWVDGGELTISRQTGDMQEYELFPRYEKGDIVLVAIIERDFSDALNGRRGNGGNLAKHELTSAVIVGKVT